MQREGGMGEKSKTCFDKVAIFAFGYSVLLRGVGTRNTMGDANTLEVLV